MRCGLYAVERSSWDLQSDCELKGVVGRVCRV